MPDRDKELHLASLQSAITEDYKKGDFVHALKKSQDLLVETEKHFGREHPATASAYNNVGLMQKLLGDFASARKNYLHSMRIYGQVVGRDHSSYAMTLHNLGSLNKSQVHFDTSLRATDRLSLVEAALEYLEEARLIRKAELGDEHPHTVATRSAIGSTLAAQVLYQHKLVTDDNANNKNGNRSAAGSSSSSGRKQYVSLNPETITRQQWQAAQEQLTEALQTAIDNPRGRRIDDRSRNSNNRSSSSNNKNNRKKKGKDLAAKLPPPLTTAETGTNQIETLSAASAGQNLAVFLKALAMTENPYNTQHLDRAKELYLQVQRVRAQLLPANHPDLYSTKYSLAELLEVMGEEDEANAIRHEIVDSYEPPPDEGLADEGEDGKVEDSGLSDPPLKSHVVVEKTVASKS